MTGYAILTDPIRRERKELKRWIESSLVFTRSLPAKNKAKRVAKNSEKKAG